MKKILIFLFILLLTACMEEKVIVANQPETFEAPYNKLHLFMTMEELYTLLGTPDLVGNQAPILGYKSGDMHDPVFYVWIEDGKVVKIRRYDGFVTFKN